MTALSAENKYILNRYFGAAGQKVGLGDLLEDALTVAATELTTTIQTSMVADNAITAAKLAAGAIQAGDVDRTAPVLDFTSVPVFTGGVGALGAAVVTDNAVNQLLCAGHVLRWHNIGQQDLGCFWVDGSGINIAGDQTDNDGIEINQGDTTSLVEKVVGTDNFYFRCKLSIATIAGTDDFYIGLRKAQAHQDAVDSYTDYFAVGMNTNDGSVKVLTDLNNAGETATDTTDDLTDGQYVDVKIWQGDEARLLSAIELMAGVKSAMNTHFADATEHTAGQQAAITAAAPTDTATLITAVTEAMAAYVTHEADAVLAASWVYHIAQTSDDDSLTSEVAPTTLAECVTRLNDLRAKLDAHVADGTAHTDGDSGVVPAAIPDAASTHCLIGVNGALAVPTAGQAFNFDSTDTLVPFIWFVQANAAQTGAVYLKNWEVVDVTTA